MSQMNVIDDSVDDGLPLEFIICIYLEQFGADFISNSGTFSKINSLPKKDPDSKMLLIRV